MSEEYAVIIKVSSEEASAFKRLFPNATIKQLRPAEEKKQEDAAQPATTEDREKLLREIVAYCRERKNNVDPVRFFTYYDGRGWLDGRGQKITDWKLKIIDWETNGMSSKPRKIVTAAEYNAAGGPFAGKDVGAMLDSMDRSIQ